LQGNSFHIGAKLFVLATGGIENARLLLLSNGVEPMGLGNRRDLVGRFFMDHIWNPSGYILPANQSAPHTIYTDRIPVSDKVTMTAHLSLPEDVVRREKLPDYRSEIGLEFDTEEAPDSHGKSAPQTHGVPQGKLASDLGPGVSELARQFSPRPQGLEWAGQKFRYRLKNYFEQVPNPDSRVTLSDEKDALGMRRAQLDWRLSELDRLCVRRAQKLLALEVGRSGFGRLRSELEDEEVLLAGARGGAHHMGTTRMGRDPGRSVVDPDCKVHGLSNLFVGGSSVFPTGGFANPTLTIVALTLRLADHIRTRYFR